MSMELPSLRQMTVDCLPGIISKSHGVHGDRTSLEILHKLLTAPLGGARQLEKHHHTASLEP